MLMCSICIDNISSEESAVALQCGHIFHDSCRAYWLSTSGTCPCCRVIVEGPAIKLFTNYEETFEQQQQHLQRMIKENSALKSRINSLEKELVLVEWDGTVNGQLKIMFLKDLNKLKKKLNKLKKCK